MRKGRKKERRKEKERRKRGRKWMQEEDGERQDNCR